MDQSEVKGVSLSPWHVCMWIEDGKEIGDGEQSHLSSRLPVCYVLPFVVAIPLVLVIARMSVCCVTMGAKQSPSAIVTLFFFRSDNKWPLLLVALTISSLITSILTHIKYSKCCKAEIITTE